MEPLALDSADRRLATALAETHYRLSFKDRDRYRRLFAAIDRGDWSQADWLTGQLEDRRLVGHVLASRYLAGGAGSFAQLRDWLDLYGDLPEADAVYRLAETRRPAGSTAPLPRPRSGNLSAQRPTPDPDSIGSSEPHTHAGELAAVRFFASDDKGALNEASHADRELGPRASQSLWLAGLSAWRLGQFSEAGRYFTALTRSETASGWMLAAGAYWAGRVEELRGASAAAGKWFASSARYRTTFYGMLAMRKLGLDIAQEISGASLSGDHLNVLAETPAGYRAVALLDIGRPDLAAAELERIDPSSNPKLNESLLVVADAAHLGDRSPILAQRISGQAAVTKLNERFPIPHWQPHGGFRVDPALVFAVVRQESGFDPKAVSPAGATGLMQLMPRTAESVGGSKRQKALFDPATNLDLGQRYISALMGDPAIGENLLLVAAAYNAGAGNLAKLTNILSHEDPLIAIESIPNDETRGFIERVLANYWIYRARMGADTSSLTDLAEGRWPRYRWDDAANDTSGAALATN
ncbi:MAG TPA: lytic transglycosylase domain-containing protein [Alphaproteobacteria bacterium]|nr:lytic transglycosylase domain-containing protein [Alphaproteobacteria bacterium]